jgi:threonyl-tRNA synthetase
MFQLSPVLLELAPGFAQVCPIWKAPVQVLVVPVVPVEDKQQSLDYSSRIVPV